MALIPRIDHRVYEEVEGLWVYVGYWGSSICEDESVKYCGGFFYGRN